MPIKVCFMISWVVNQLTNIIGSGNLCRHQTLDFTGLAKDPLAWHRQLTRGHEPKMAHLGYRQQRGSAKLLQAPNQTSSTCKGLCNLVLI